MAKIDTEKQTKLADAERAHKYLGAPQPPDKIKLKDTTTDAVIERFIVDAREIVANPDGRYVPADAEARRVLNRESANVD